MSKRFVPQQHGGGDRKRAKLDISVSDHNFPLSQTKEPEKGDTWGDDNDDEILLLASQACEDAYNIGDVSLLPNYSMCMQPGSTSTQLYPSPGPSTSKSEFTFKMPSTGRSNTISTHLREKCNRISSPLPGITAKVMPKVNEPVSVSDDLIFNDQIYKGQDSDYIYRQLLQLQEENAKLKSENGKLLEKCVTKEGEASILRTQLKTCQVAVDHARLEKIKAQEKVQMEWTEKLAAANGQMHDLKTQLDFKNLEIISIKEKCKKLESTKVRLTQVTVANNDISSSYRPNNSFTQNESMNQNRKVKTSTNAVQTDDKAHFIALNKTCKLDTLNLSTLLPYIMEPPDSPHSLLDYNEIFSCRDVPRKCRVFTTFHRIPPSTTVVKEGKDNMQLTNIHQDIVKIAGGFGGKDVYFNVFNAAYEVLTHVLSRLETISRKMATSFQKEMDEKYIESSSEFLEVSREDLLKGRALYKEEQEINARRITAILSYILETSSSHEMLTHYEQSQTDRNFTKCISKICHLLDTTSTAPLYSGLLLAITFYIQLFIHSTPRPQTLQILKSMITSRAMPVVSCHILELVRDVSLWENFRIELCPGTSVGNLKMDYDQGVVLYKKDSCYLQILLKQVETCLKCIERENLIERAVSTTRQLLHLYNNLNCDSVGLAQDKSRCDCQLVLVQVIVYSLRICAVMLLNSQPESNNSLLPLCRCGVQFVYRCSLRDVEFSSQLAHCEGHLLHFCHILRGLHHTELIANMLSELMGTLQSTPEDMPPSFHKEAWLKSFESFSMSD